MCEITLERISFYYGPDVVLENLNFTVKQGEFVVIVGPNGGGKSTLIKLMAGLVRPAQGRITIDGQDISKAHRNQCIGYVPQNYRQNTADFPATVAEIVALGLVAGTFGNKRTPGEKSHIVKHTLELVGIDDLANCRIGDLSGGQQQRVMVARALTGNPSLLLLDEPMSGVDVQASETIYELLAELNSKLNITVVLVSHDVEKATQYASQVACINRKLCFYGSNELFRVHHLKSSHLWY
jgi:zinc transport system ATP-binding protein